MLTLRALSVCKPNAAEAVDGQSSSATPDKGASRCWMGSNPNHQHNVVW
jgi:hypothetical protein